MRVVLIFPGALGDFLLLAPAVAELARRGAQVALSVTRAVVPLATQLFPGCIGPPADGAIVGSLFSDARSLVLDRWLSGADVVHVWLGAAGEALERAAPQLGIRTVVPHAVERGPGERHASDAYAASVGVDGGVAPIRFDVVPAPAPFEWQCAAAAALVIHPGAGSPAKRWSAAGFERVAAEWAGNGGGVVVLLGPAERRDAQHWRTTGHRVVEGLTIMEAAAMIAGARWYVGNDSGVSHLAGALWRSGAVLFGPTSAARWRPLGGHLAVIDFAGRALSSVCSDVLHLLRAPGTGASDPT